MKASRITPPLASALRTSYLYSITYANPQAYIERHTLPLALYHFFSASLTKIRGLFHFNLYQLILTTANSHFSMHEVDLIILDKEPVDATFTPSFVRVPIPHDRSIGST